jgi:uncharacterized membrane protein HdeD (DUF308 family)
VLPFVGKSGVRPMRGLEPGGNSLIILGVILLIIGFVAAVHIIWILGIIVLVVGAVLAIVGFGGREIAGRRHWY